MGSERTTYEKEGLVDQKTHKRIALVYIVSESEREREREGESEMKRKNNDIIWGLLFSITITLFRVLGAKVPSGGSDFKKITFLRQKPKEI